MINARHIGSELTPLVRGRLYPKILQIIKGDIKPCEYCGKPIELWRRKTIKYHPSCRSEHCRRLKNMKGRTATLSDGKRVKIVDVKKGILLVTRFGLEHGTPFEAKDPRSLRNDGLPIIERYLWLKLF